MIAVKSVRGYGRKNISPRCMVQMNIQKAYDTIEWMSLAQIMVEMSFLIFLYGYVLPMSYINLL